MTTYVLGLLLAGSIASGTECDTSCRERLIGDYFARIGRVFHSRSTEGDINRLFELFDEKVRYQHLDYGADFEKGAWKEAFLGNLKRGAYDKQANQQIKVVTLIHGKQHTAVGYAYGAFQPDGVWKPSDDQVLLALFGFAGNKIVLVREYW